MEMSDIIQIISAISALLGILGVACGVFLFFVKLRLTPLEDELKDKASSKELSNLRKEFSEVKEENEALRRALVDKASKKEVGYKASAEGLENLKNTYETFVKNNNKNMDTLFDTLGEISSKNANYRVELAEKYVRNDRFNVDMDRVNKEIDVIHGRITASGKKK
jgi:chromosome segregation ATPase